jgi:hypothetical protein
MEAMVTKSVGEIPDDARRGLEGLLGHELQPDQRVFVMVLSANPVPDEPTRRGAAQGIRSIIAQAQHHADALGVSDDEIDSAVEEAMAHVRRRAP